MASKKYKVISLSVGGIGNKIHRLNDEVTEDNFPPGNASILEENGFLECIDDGSDEAETDVKATEPNEDPTPKSSKKKNRGGRK